MAKNSGFNLNLPSLDDLFTTEAEREDAKLEKVVLLPPEEISEFPNHPFQVRMDDAMKEMAQSVRENGVLVPALVRTKVGGGYEMVSGHRRKRAAELAGLREIPCIVRDLTDDQAVVIMVDSNLQREQILPSEKALVSDILEINVSTNLDNIIAGRSASRSLARDKLRVLCPRFMSVSDRCSSHFPFAGFCSFLKEGFKELSRRGAERKPLLCPDYTVGSCVRECLRRRRGCF